MDNKDNNNHNHQNTKENISNNNIEYTPSNGSSTDFDTIWDDIDSGSDTDNNATDSSNNFILNDNSDDESNENIQKPTKKLSEKKQNRINRQKANEIQKQIQNKFQKQKLNEQTQILVETNVWNISQINDIFQHIKSNLNNKSFNQQNIINTLQQLMKQCKHYNEQSYLTILSILISFYFNNTTMNNTQWKQCKHLISQMIISLNKNINTIKMSNDCDIILLLKSQQINNKISLVYGNLFIYIQKLTNYLWKHLKTISQKTTQYNKILHQTTQLIEIYKNAIDYFSKLKDKKSQCEIELLWMSIIYNDYNSHIDELKQKKITTNQNIFNLLNILIVNKAKFILNNGTKRMKIKAILYLIYNMALHNKYKLCHNLLLMPQLNSLSKMGYTNIELQILYNRTLAMYSICCFCCEDYYSCMMILQQLFSSRCINILLAQGYSKIPMENASNQQIIEEKLQKYRMVPSHFYIAYDTLESIHLLSTLFVETSNIMNGNIITNIYFNRIYNGYLKRDLILPPQNTQNIILNICKNIQNGNWIKCKNLIKKLKLWNSLEIKNVKYILKHVLLQIKKECLRCYLYRFGYMYKNIFIKQLSKMFDLKEYKIKQFIYTFIMNEKQMFLCLDELTQCVVIKKKKPTQMQKIALKCSDKILFLIQQNEKLLGVRMRSQR